jgi:DNA-binding transcriptional ArsR family regulator
MAEGTLQTSSEPDVAGVARAIGHPARATMLAALLGGQWLPAGELARRAGVTPSTASDHLSRLVRQGIITPRRSGRHRYYALSGPEVAAALEGLARIPGARAEHSDGLHDPAGALTSNRSIPPGLRALHFARTCYDHLAGRLGVLLTDAMLERDLIAPAGFEPTHRGAEWLRGLDIHVADLRRERRVLARPCLDWSERRDHLAGAVGAALASSLLDRGWIVRMEGTRAVRLTLRGREGLYRTTGLEATVDT